ncbi:hypothetical protein [Streptomyces sp. NEAU-H3]|uniref:hypothetical protein n=1 Tax=Streptomyces sp. NEAU-H3 TaxID=2720636 RepID=UPI00143B1552|nr:hypothetical protein [Streptomyces sp. NEAU-H3]NJA56716.1 hypothetical protein [Streptomyces sp. NEAU-H3]
MTETTNIEDTVLVPRATFERLRTVASHVSLGRTAALVGRYPYAAARRALGELHDAGLLPETSSGGAQ